MNSFKHFIESTFDQQGFWTGKGGKGASGILPIAADTSRIGLSIRSAATHSLLNGQTVNKVCLGTIGGAIKGSNPLNSAKIEVKEESGFTGPYLQITPGYVFSSGTFKYYNYIATVPHEFEFKPQSDSHWESLGLLWAQHEDLIGKRAYGGYPMHDGLVDLLSNSKNIIEQHIAANNSNKQ